MEDRPETEYYLRDEQVEASDASIDEVGALCTEECSSKGPRGKEPESEKVATKRKQCEQEREKKGHESKELCPVHLR